MLHAAAILPKDELSRILTRGRQRSWNFNKIVLILTSFTIFLVSMFDIVYNY